MTATDTLKVNERELVLDILLLVTKAISMPEKNAERTMEIRMPISSGMSMLSNMI